MKQQLKCKVIMLPTKEATIAYKSIVSLNGKDLAIPIKDGIDPVDEFEVNHLYLVSDREIKIGDWYHNPAKSAYGNPHNEKCEYDHEAKACLNEPVCKRIEASTDPSLNLSLIPQSFIEAYIKANGKIDEVNIEIVPSFEKGDKITGLDSPWDNSESADIEQELDYSREYIITEVGLGLDLIKLDCFTELVRTSKVLPLSFKIKTREDNTVIIHQAKTYTREEVINHLKEYEKGRYLKSLGEYITENL